MLLEEGEHLLDVPGRVPELDRQPDPAGQLRQEVAQPGVVPLVLRVQLHQQDARAGPSSCQPAAIRSIHCSGSSSRLACVRPRGAFTDSRNPGGSRSRQPAKVRSGGQR